MPQAKWGSFQPSGFFVLRTPLLPWDDFLGWSASSAENDRVQLRARLNRALEDPRVDEALVIASPALHSELGCWRSAPDTERGAKIEAALVRYFARMCGRATPFGLFAGCSIGTLASQSRLRLGERSALRRQSRLDMQYLCALTNDLSRDENLRQELHWRPNSSLCHSGGRWRYAEARTVHQERSYRLVDVEPTPYLDATLELARFGARLSDLERPLAAHAGDDEARSFVRELTEAQILVSELEPPVTGTDPLTAIKARLRRCPSGAAAAEILDSAAAALSAMDTAGVGLSPERYRGIARMLAFLPTPVDPSRLVQVDLFKTAALTLGPRPVAELRKGVELLHRLWTPPRKDELAEFQASFLERFGDREVPLMAALDEEAGIGFAVSRGPSSEAPAFDDLPWNTPGQELGAWRAREVFLLEKCAQAQRSKSQEIELTEPDVARLELKDVPPLPPAFAVVATFAARDDEALDRGEFQVCLEDASGPPAARLLGRFCHADSDLAARVRACLRAEEALRPNAIFAEIVHLPEGRMGNVLLRPLLRDHEIPYLGTSGADTDHQLSVEDLRVSVRGDRVVLRSDRLQKEIVPRLTAAHNHLRGLGVYRFLCALQTQGVASPLRFSWGALEDSPFLPRLRCGKVILSLKRWKLDRAQIRCLTHIKNEQSESVTAGRALRQELGLPRFVAVADGDHVLPVDLDNALSVESMAQILKGRGNAFLTEVFPVPEGLCVSGPEGRFVHEIVLPFCRVEEAPSEGKIPPRNDRLARTFPPGSEWAYVKAYSGTATIDRLLLELVAPFVRQAQAAGWTDRWFFVRYGDPHWHLRLRFHGPPDRLWPELVPALLARFAEAVADGRVHRVQLDTYEREVERYGGSEGIDAAETLFQLDSEAALQLLDFLKPNLATDDRWKLTLRGVDQLAEDLGLGLEERHAAVFEARQALLQELKVPDAFTQGLSERFRRERSSLEGFLTRVPAAENPLAAAGEILRQRSERSHGAVEILRGLGMSGHMAWSFLHMHANRMLRSAPRAQELVLYDFLARMYASRAARQSRK